jgi:ribokinase
MKKEPKLLVIGHTASDVIIGVEDFPKINTSTHMESMKHLFGGAGANVAMVAAICGLDTTLISAVGENFKQTEYYNSLIKNNINTDYLIYVKGEPNATAIMVNNENNDQVTYFYEGAGAQFSKNPVPVEAISKADFVHLATGDPDYNWKASCEAKKQGKPVSFDPGQDLTIYSAERLKQVIENSTILFGNNYEIDRILKTLNLDIDGLLDLGPEIIIKTCREYGSILYTKDGEIKVDAIVRPAVDPTGAGDSYKAAFLYYYLNGKSLDEAIRFSSSVSSFIVEKQGCQTNIPSLEEAEDRMNSFYN